jgi:hypothetical protein
MGIMASILGMLFRYKAHKEEQRETRKKKKGGAGSAVQ